LKKTILSILAGSLFLVACNKAEISVEKSEPCVNQAADPAGKSYTSDAIVPFTCTEKHCGLLPLSSRFYWVYADSLFDNGVFQKVVMDTLRFTSNRKTQPDNMVWWESDYQVGLPSILYTNDSAIYSLGERMFIPGILDARKEYGLFAGDSVKYLTSFEDAAAMGRSVKVSNPVKTEAGSFSNCLFFEKHARSYRRDQVFFKPGIGVVRYVHEEAPMGQRELKLQRVATLVRYFIQ
jgi:hypothetical protein